MRAAVIVFIFLLGSVAMQAQNIEKEKRQNIAWLEKQLTKNYKKELSFKWGGFHINDSIITFTVAYYRPNCDKCAPEKQITQIFRIECLAKNELKLLTYYTAYDPKKMSKWRRNFYGMSGLAGKTARKKVSIYGIELPPDCYGNEETKFPYDEGNDTIVQSEDFLFYTENEKQAKKIKQKIDFLNKFVTK